VKKNLTKLSVVLLSLILVTSLFAGCSKTEGAKGEQIMVYNVGAEPETLDPGLNTSVDGGITIINCFEGLTRLDKDGVPGPGIATNWDVSPDKLVYTFHLRKDAKWSDGTPITANDLKYSWERIVNPDTQAEYVTQILMVKNAAEVNAGKMGADQLGIKVVDDYTYEVTLAAPTPYFLEICAFPTLIPVKKDVVEKDPEGWATKAETYIGNGPFKMVSWVNNDHIMFEKNEHYWDAKNVKLDKLKFVIVVEASSALTAWEKGDIDVIGGPPPAELERLKSEGNLKIFPLLGAGYTIYNITKKPFDDVRVRQALNLAVNRKQICENVLRAGQLPGTGFVPYGIKDADGKSDFRTVGGDYLPIEPDIAKAKQLLADAGYPDGKGFPEVTYCYNTHEVNKAVAEAVQNMWKTNLNINVTLENMEWKVFIPKRQNGDFHIARGGWLGDYMDPMTYLDIFTSISGNNDSQLASEEYDGLIASARAEADPEKRMEYLHNAEKFLMDNAILCPQNFTVQTACIKDYVKDATFTSLGFWDFNRAYIDYEVKNAK
jgi:oligopeptide transport system substrate-binding protein